MNGRREARRGEASSCELLLGTHPYHYGHPRPGSGNLVGEVHFLIVGLCTVICTIEAVMMEAEWKT